MKWEKVAARIAAKEAETGAKDKIVQIKDHFHYTIFGQALCNEKGNAFPPTSGEAPTTRQVAEAYRTMKANQKSFEAFMVLCGGYYPDVASLRVKVAGINKRIKELWEAKHGTIDTAEAMDKLQKVQLRGLKIKNKVSEITRKPRAGSVDEELDKYISGLI
jgi:hypothetical protein